MPPSEPTPNRHVDSQANGHWVEVIFDCMPLRTVPRVDVPLDASPKLAAKILRVKAALEKHGSLNTYYLHNAKCTYHLTNDPQQGMMEFDFEGVVLTDQRDMQAHSCDLQIALKRETCSWLNQSIVEWLSETVQRNVLVDFNRFIAQGDLTKTLQRIEQTQQASDEAGGYVGMYL
ncbi:MAG: hypothetical protein ABI557_17885 [Aureliella sp.]